jgi:type I restriction enzyme, S subunit
MKYEMVRLGDVCETTSGGTPSRANKEFWDNGDIPWIKSGQLKDSNIYEAEEFITALGLKRSSSKLIPSGTLLLALYGATAGKLGFLEIEATINQAICALTPDASVLSNRYLFYYLLSIRKKIIEDSAGGAQPNISQKYVQELDIPLPPLSIQREIADLLDKADALRRKDRELLQAYEALAQAIFMDMFGDPVTNEKGWEVKKLGEVCDKITDGTHDTPERLTEGVKFITGKHIRPYIVDYDNSDYVTEEVHNEIYRRCNPMLGDILYTNIGVNYATAAMNTVEYEFSMKNVALIKFKRELLKGRFLEFLLNNGNFKNRLRTLTGIGGAQQFLSLAQIKSIGVLLPPIELQTEFEDKVKSLFNAIYKVNLTLLNSESLFQTLLQTSFS